MRKVAALEGGQVVYNGSLVGGSEKILEEGLCDRDEKVTRAQ